MWVIPCPAAPPAAGSDPLNTASQVAAPAARLPASADASAPATAAGRGKWEARSEKAARANGWARWDDIEWPGEETRSSTHAEGNTSATRQRAALPPRLAGVIRYLRSLYVPQRASEGRRCEAGPQSAGLEGGAEDEVAGLSVVSGGWVDEIEDLVWIPALDTKERGVREGQAGGGTLLVVAEHTPVSLFHLLRFHPAPLVSAKPGGGHAHAACALSRALVFMAQAFQALSGLCAGIRPAVRA